MIDLFSHQNCGFVEGRVVDVINGKPINKATVLVPGSGRYETKEDGRFRFPELPETQIGIAIRVDGYYSRSIRRSHVVQPNESYDIGDIGLLPDSYGLEFLSVYYKQESD